MKILISAYSCDPTAGGESGNGFNWAYNNALLGHEVWCLTTADSQGNIEKHLKAVNITNLHFIYVGVAKWVRFTYRYQPGVYFNYIVWQHNAYKVARQLDKKVDFDIVHHVTWGSLQLGSAMWRLKKPLIFGPVGGGQTAPPGFEKYFLQWWKQETTRTRISKLLLLINSDVRKTVKNAKVVLVTNQETYDLAKKLGASRLEFFLDTSLPEDFYPKISPVRPPAKVLRILWVGRLFARKGLPLVLEALSKVNPGVDFHLTILGGGLLGEFIPGWLKEFSLEGKVEWKGQVTWQKVQEAYLSHDVFMFCSLRDSFASQFLEAMANSLPIITLNIHGVKKLVPDNVGIKVEVSTPEKTVEELANAVEYMYHHPQERIILGKNGYEYAKTQTWPLKTRQVNKFYELYSNSNAKVHI